MAVLAQPELFDCWRNPDGIQFEPDIEESQIKHCSIDLRLGSVFKRLKHPPVYRPPLILNTPELFRDEDAWEVEESEIYTLQPREFVVAFTWEKVKIPGNLMGLVEGRSSLSRLGVSVQSAPKIDPGFDNQITLELFNAGPQAVPLKAREERVAQLILLQLTSAIPHEHLYGASGDDQFGG